MDEKGDEIIQQRGRAAMIQPVGPITRFSRGVSLARNLGKRQRITITFVGFDNDVAHFNLTFHVKSYRGLASIGWIWLMVKLWTRK